jgi:hypothetical protein
LNFNHFTTVHGVVFAFSNRPQRARQNASDEAIRQAIITSVKFEGAAEAHFKWDGDFWQCVVRAVAQAAAQYPDFLDTTYRDARNNLAYYMK